MVLFEEEKRYEPSFLFSVLFLTGIAMFFISCASKPSKQIVYEPTANAVDEIRNLQTEMDRAEAEQIAVFAPRSYPQAYKAWVKAKALQERGEPNSRVLEELGRARTYFEQARSVASRSLKALPEVADSRENALIAGAKLYHRPELDRADAKLTDLTEDFERNRTVKIRFREKVDLQQRYLDLELKGIKTTRLGDAWSALAQAKRMGAENYAPRSLASAQGKIKNAELVIETDRHNDALVTAASMDALNEARRLLKVTEISKRSGGRKGNESLALEVVQRDERLAQMNQQMAATEAQRREQEAEYQRRLQEAQRSTASAEQSAQAAASRAAAQQQMEAMYKEAQAQFTSEEADVYRQGDNLILRLKSIQFPSGRTEVPSASFRTLNKVSEVINDLQAGSVIVEGHTDSTGKPETNKRISEQRAQAVAQYLESDSQRSGTATAAEAPMIESKGLGSEFPIVSNRTKEGRAQNRRVDIIIIPEMAAAQ